MNVTYFIRIAGNVHANNVRFLQELFTGRWQWPRYIIFADASAEHPSAVPKLPAYRPTTHLQMIVIAIKNWFPNLHQPMVFSCTCGIPLCALKPEDANVMRRK